MNEILRHVTDDLQNGVLALPRMHGSVQYAMQVVNDEDSSMSAIARAISVDPSIAARIMQVANSAWYWADVKVSTVQNAVARLGVRTTYLTLLGFGVRDTFKSNRKECQTYLSFLWNDSLRLAATASALAKRTERLSKDTAFLVGLLTHIGKLPLLAFYERHAGPALPWSSYLEFMEETGDSFRRLILIHWGFPEDILGLVAQEQLPSTTEPSYADLVWAARNVSKLVALEFNEAPAARRLGVKHEDIQYAEPDAEIVLRDMATLFA